MNAARAGCKDGAAFQQDAPYLSALYGATGPESAQALPPRSSIRIVARNDLHRFSSGGFSRCGRSRLFSAQTYSKTSMSFGASELTFRDVNGFLNEPGSS